MKFNEHWLLVAGIALAASFPNLVHAKPAPVVWSETDPIGTYIGQKMGWDAPAPRPASKPAAKPKPAPVVTPALSAEVSQAAVEAEKTARAFRHAERRDFEVAFSNF